MTDAEKLTQLIDAVTDMRIFQKAFHTSTKGTSSWQQNLQDSKTAEARVDKLLAELKSKQVKMELG